MPDTPSLCCYVWKVMQNCSEFCFKTLSINLLFFLLASRGTAVAAAAHVAILTQVGATIPLFCSYLGI